MKLRDMRYSILNLKWWFFWNLISMRKRFDKWLHTGSLNLVSLWLPQLCCDLCKATVNIIRLREKKIKARECASLTIYIFWINLYYICLSNIQAHTKSSFSFHTETKQWESMEEIQSSWCKTSTKIFSSVGQWFVFSIHLKWLKH